MEQEQAVFTEQDERYMQEALRLAAEAGSAGEVPIGAVVVSRGVIVGRGRNRREEDKTATAHAELLAIEEACATVGGWRIPDATLYVTLEPCPMCAGAALNARIGRIVYGAADPKSGACGSPGAPLDVTASGALNHTPTVDAGLLEDACRSIIQDFFRARRKKPEAANAESTPQG